MSDDNSQPGADHNQPTSIHRLAFICSDNTQVAIPCKPTSKHTVLFQATALRELFCKWLAKAPSSNYAFFKDRVNPVFRAVTQFRSGVPEEMGIAYPGLQYMLGAVVGLRAAKTWQAEILSFETWVHRQVNRVLEAIQRFSSCHSVGTSVGTGDDSRLQARGITEHNAKNILRARMRRHELRENGKAFLTPQEEKIADDETIAMWDDSFTPKSTRKSRPSAGESSALANSSTTNRPTDRNRDSDATSKHVQPLPSITGKTRRRSSSPGSASEGRQSKDDKAKRRISI